jgi:hypothetical protein
MLDVDRPTITRQPENVSHLEKPGQRGLKYREDFARTSEQVLERLDATLDLTGSLRRDLEGFIASGLEGGECFGKVCSLQVLEHYQLGPLLSE